MKKYFTVVLQEFRKNVGFYLTVLICGTLLVLDIFNIATPEAITSGILATLLLISFGMLTQSRVDEKIQRSLEQIEMSSANSAKFFREWEDTNFVDRLKTAREVNFMTISGYALFNEHSERFVEFVRTGGVLKCILINPEGVAIKMASERSFGAARQPEYLKMQIQLSLEKLKEFADVAKDKNCVQIKMVDILPEPILTMIDSKSPHGIMFITLNGFGQPIASRPSFVLQKNRDEHWFTFYENSFENFWTSAEGVRLDLKPEVSDKTT